MIRPARSDELERLREIERAAGRVFTDIPMNAIAEDEPLSAVTLAGYPSAGRLWVGVDRRDEPVAYLLLEIVDAEGHIVQVSVDPTHARRGLGASLIDTTAAWARERGLRSLTLSTFRDVPRNRPYYERLGFRVVDDEQLTPGLRHVRSEEIATGLDQWPRVVMRRPC